MKDILFRTLTGLFFMFFMSCFIISLFFWLNFLVVILLGEHWNTLFVNDGYLVFPLGYLAILGTVFIGYLIGGSD